MKVKTFLLTLLVICQTDAAPSKWGKMIEGTAEVMVASGLFAITYQDIQRAGLNNSIRNPWMYIRLISGGLWLKYGIKDIKRALLAHEEKTIS